MRWMRDIYCVEEFSAHDVICHAGHDMPLMAPIVGAGCWYGCWHYIFWILTIAAILASVMILLWIISRDAPVERRQPFSYSYHNSNPCCVVSPQTRTELYAGERFSFAGMFSFERGAVCLYRNYRKTPPQDFCHYFRC